MSKLIGEPVKVHIKEKESIMTAFIWRKKLYHVNQVLSWWREPDEWWYGKSIRFFVRVEATGSDTGAYELYRLGKQWFLSRILD
ncbi:DUF6504 family protein [Chloroflexota bacterium]